MRRRPNMTRVFPRRPPGMHGAARQGSFGHSATLPVGATMDPTEEVVAVPMAGNEQGGKAKKTAAKQANLNSGRGSTVRMHVGLLLLTGGQSPEAGAANPCIAFCPTHCA